MKQVEYRAIGVTMILLCFFVQLSYGQKESKTYKETFNVGSNAVLDIATTYADIEFETWDKNQVVVEAIIEIEGMSKKEAEAYFKRNKIDITGNSEKINIRTGKQGNSFVYNIEDWNDRFNFNYNIVIPELPDLDESVYKIYEFPELKLDYDWDKLSDLNFDYKAYDKEGEKYMKEWKKENGKALKELRKVIRDEVKEKREKTKEEWDEHIIQYKKLRAKRKERNEKKRKAYLERKEALLKRKKERLKLREAYRISIDSLKFDMDSLTNNINELLLHVDTLLINSPNTFYFPSRIKDKKYKIKKTIKIKMPKSATLKMNVRHGEVKLAENTKNIKANLAYASLFGYAIDGDNTEIRASYSPISVEKWNYGQLTATYSEHIELKEVQNLILSATSSDVTIDRMLKSAFIQNDFGPLRINYIAKSFRDMDINIENGEFHCKLPATPFTILVNGTSSKLNAPTNLILKNTEGNKHTLHKGYYKNKDNDKSITINSKYSEVTLRE